MTEAKFAALKKGDRIVHRRNDRVVWIVGRRVSVGIKITPDPGTSLADFAMWGPKLRSGLAMYPVEWLLAPEQST